MTYPVCQATEVRVSLKETSGQRVTLRRPEFATLARKDGVAKVQAEAGVACILNARGDEVEFPLVLAPGAVQLLRVQLSPLRHPGEYTGSLQFGSPDYAVLEQSVTVMKRHWGLFAALVIFVGILLSFVQRTYFSRTRPRKQQVRDASKLTVRLGEALKALPPLDDREQAASAWLVIELKAIHDTADGRDATHNRLTLAAERLNLFTQEVPARVMLNSVRPLKHADQFRHLLTEALGLVTNANAQLDQFSQRAGDLRDLPTALFATARTALQGQIMMFLQEVQNQIIDHDITQALRADLQTQVEVLLRASADRLADARQLSDVDAERTEFDKARGNYAKVLSEALNRVLTGEPPPGFTPEDWPRLYWDVVGPEVAAAVKAAGTDPAAAIDYYNRAFACYVVEVVAALTKEARQRSQALDQAPQGATDEEKRKRDVLRARYDNEVIATLNNASRTVRQGDARAAAAFYQQALGVYRELNRAQAAAVAGAAAMAGAPA